jgi:hypothetical protein
MCICVRHSVDLACGFKRKIHIHVQVNFIVNLPLLILCPCGWLAMLKHNKYRYMVLETKKNFSLSIVISLCYILYCDINFAHLFDRLVS